MVTSDCARSFITHNVTVVREADGTVIMIAMNEDNRIDIGTDSLEPNQNYSILVSVNIVHGIAHYETSEAAVIVCTTSEDLSPSTAATATPGLFMFTTMCSYEVLEIIIHLIKAKISGLVNVVNMHSLISPILWYNPPT